MVTEDLAAFLAARYDEAEAAAKAATPGPWAIWTETDPATIWGDGDTVPVIQGARLGGLPAFGTDEDAAHIAACDPAHRLADIALKRAILAEHYHGRADTVDPGRPDFGCYACDQGGDYGIIGNGWCATVRQLGTEFATHPEYRDEWRP